MKAFIKTHPVLTYFVLAFAISWGGVLLVIGGPHGIPGTAAQTDPLFPFVYLAMLGGPSAAGILLTGVVSGRAGLRALLSRVLNWRIGARWYVTALLTAPLLAAAALVALSFFSPEFLPGISMTDDRAGLMLFGLVVAMGAGFFEELGWTGFAVPELRRRYGVLATGLIVGLLWSAWHFLVVAWGIGSRTGAIPLALFVVADGLTFLPAFRVLMVWVYDRTGNLLVGMLMHLSLTATAVILGPVTTGVALVAYDFVFAVAVWIVVAGLAVANGGQLARQPLGRRAA